MGYLFWIRIINVLVGGFTKLKKYPAQGLYPIEICQKSRMFGKFSPRYLDYLENHNSTSQNHDYGISSQDFMNNLHLRRFYNILATSIDNNGKEYVAAMEAKYYPIYGVQWHPERQEISGPFIDFFISELKKNNHICKSPFLRNNMKAHKCVQYPEHKNLLCYFF